MQATRKIFLLAICLGGVPFFASSLTIKLASPLPDDSPWGYSLQKLKGSWERLSEGKVKVRIYSGGVVGKAPDVIRKMRIGQIDAGVFSATGLLTIDSDLLVTNLPFFLENEEEVDFILRELLPILQDSYRKKGFEILFIGQSGWIYFFTQKPVFVPDDLRRQSIGIGDAGWIMDAWKAIEMKVTPLSFADTFVGLQSGRVEGLVASPLVAATYQWFPFVPNMLNLRVVPLLGVLLVRKKTWERIPGAVRTKLLPAVGIMKEDFQRGFDTINRKAMEVMTKHGLKRNSVSAAQAKEWTSLLKKAYASVIGEGKISPHIYKVAREKIDRYREGTLESTKH